jgi:hypothetical protein
MDIDQRLDRLTERHEALTQSVELFVASTRGNLDRFERVSEENDARLIVRMADLAARIAHLTGTMNRLGHIAVSHDERLDEVKHRLEDLEGKS